MLQDSIYYTLAQINQDWIYNQALPITLLISAVIWLVRKLDKLETERATLARDVIKLASMYEAKNDKTDSNNKEISDQLNKIINLISKNGNNY